MRSPRTCILGQRRTLQRIHALILTTPWEALARQNAEFGLVRDLAKALKHVELVRGTPRVKDASQMGTEGLGFDVARFDEARFDSPAQVVVTTNLGGKRVVESVLQNALTFLKQEMVGLGL